MTHLDDRLAAHSHAGAEVRRLRQALSDIARWRDIAHEHDDDMGYPRREFADAEDWEQLERFALETLVTQ